MAGDIEEGDAVPLEPNVPCKKKRRCISTPENAPVEAAGHNAKKEAVLANRKAKAQAKGGKKHCPP